MNHCRPFNKREVERIQVQKNYMYWFLLQKTETILFKDLEV